MVSLLNIILVFIVMNIPKFPLEGYSTIDHKQAEEEYWFKVDFLNVEPVYKDIIDEAHLDRLVNLEKGELFEHEEIVEQL